jgi:hypothetical protein
MAVLFSAGKGIFPQLSAAWEVVGIQHTFDE